jgi:hypothetical protein
MMAGDQMRLLLRNRQSSQGSRFQGLELEVVAAMPELEATSPLGEGQLQGQSQDQSLQLLVCW